VKLKFTRRDFVISTAKVMAVGLLAPAGALAATKFASAQDTSQQNPILKQWAGKEWNFVVDTAKCIGCGSCVKACKKENSVPLDKEVYRTWVERYLVDTNEEVKIDSPRGGLDFQQQVTKPEKQFFVPKLCNQCKHASCIQVCRWSNLQDWRRCCINR
jgi:tetrathionate reductase subunit B